MNSSYLPASRKFFETQLLKTDSELYTNITEQYYNSQPVFIIRFRFPSSHKPGGFHQDGYRGYLIYYRVKHYNEENANEFEIYGPETEHLDCPDYFFHNIIAGYFCCCKSGQRELGACVHITAAVMKYGTNFNFDREVFRALDGSTFRNDEPMEH